MKGTKKIQVATGTSRSRYAELKQMLEERRREMHDEVKGKMRGVREDHPKTRTTSYRGVYVESAQLRGEFYDVSGLRGGGS